MILHAKLKFTPSPKCLSLLRDAETLLKLGEANDVKAPASGLFTEAFEPKESFFRIKELEKSWGFDFPVRKS